MINFFLTLLWADLIANWYNSSVHHPFVKAAIAHLWFEVIHPFDDGNGRIGRTLVDKMLCEADKSAYRYYSFSTTILKKKKEYYNELNKASRGDLDITKWIVCFLKVIVHSVEGSEHVLNKVDFKKRFWEKYSGEKFNDRQLKVVKKLWKVFREI
ncbi:MAG: Fic family protein [Flavobacteriales bacterium]|nr:Fic family protein [Flavobacteriales bacterium]